jgi:DnaJ homolog subfamily A member 2
MLRGQGMPSPRHHDMGNMYITFNVKFPEKGWTADPSAFDALRALLPAPGPEAIPPPDAMTEPVELEDVDPQGKAKGFGQGVATDEDDEDGHPHGERVQCASQ